MTVFTERFKNAIDFEQKIDLDLTTVYLNTYSPKKLAKLGLAVLNLVVQNVRTGLGGKTLVDLVLSSSLGKDQLEAGDIRVGDIVKLNRMGSLKSDSESDDVGISGVIFKVTSQTIVISVDGDDTNVLNFYTSASDDLQLWIVKLLNSVTYKRMITTMNKLNELSEKPDIISMLLGEMSYSPFGTSDIISDKDFYNKNLNQSQKDAINFSLNSPLTIVHGPPGTGKTYTLTEIIQQLVKRKERVLVCGPSNISVDTILERLTPAFASRKARRRLIRVGHPARLLNKNLEHSLDILSKEINESILRDINKDIKDTLSKIKTCKNRLERKGLYQELKQFRKELRSRELKMVRDLLIDAEVIVSTLHGAGARELMTVYDDKNYNPNNPFFDTIIIDEVSQSMEPQCWIPLVNHVGFKRLIIAGDNMQLPPTIKSIDEKTPKGAANLEVTLFDRLVNELHGNEYKKLLDVQYRMNKAIMNFPSDELYEGKLKAFKDNADILLTDLPGVNANDDTTIPCIWYDTQGGDFYERTDEDDEMNSKFNDMEALVVERHLESLVESGVEPSHIGVISPYNAQVSLLRKQLNKFKGLEISTVDGFQGREKECIIILLVRSNENWEVGFLKDKRRLNVAITRPKRQLCVVGDLELLSRSTDFLKHLAQHVEDEYEVRYPDIGDY